MATTLEDSKSQQYVDFDEYIDYQLQKTRGNIKTTDILTAFAHVAVFVLAYLLLFVICDHWVVAEGFSQSTRILALSLVTVFSLGWLAWKVLWPYLRQVNALFAAKVLEQSQPELRSTLLNLIDAQNAGQAVSPTILSVMEKRAAVSLSNTNVEEAIDRKPLMWACYAVLALVVAFSMYAIFTPKKVSASLWRALFPASALEAPTETVIDNVSPGDVTVIPGTRLKVTVDISGEIPEELELRYSTADREFVDEPLTMREVPEVPRRFEAEIIGANGEGILQDLTYQIFAGDDRSQTFYVAVEQPPSAELVKLWFDYPAYMKIPRKTRPEETEQPDADGKIRVTGEIDEYEGTIVTFIAESNMPLKSATVTFSDDQGTNFRAEAIPMTPMNGERTRFRARWTLAIRPEDGIYPRYYAIKCKNEKGHSDPNPTTWPIRIRPDLRPSARIVNPQEDEIERPANAIVPLTAMTDDDFRVSKLTLWKQRNDEPQQVHAVIFQGSEASVSVDYNWRLNDKWTIEVGDRVSYWVQAEDNRTPRAGRRNSNKKTIIIGREQSEEKIQEQLEADQKLRQQERENPDSESTSDPAQSQKTERTQENPPQNTEPNPQQNEPQENPENKTGESQASEENQGGGGGEKSGTQQKQGGLKKDGTDDGEALESLHRHFSQDKQEPGENDNNRNPNNEEPAKVDTGEEKKPSPNMPDENPSPEKSPNPKPNGDQPEGKPEKTPNQNTPDKQPGDKPEPDDKTPKDPNNTPSEKPNPEQGTEPKNEGQDPNSKSPEKPETSETPEKTPNDQKGPGEDPGTPGDNETKTENPDGTPGDDGKTGGGEKPSPNSDVKPNGAGGGDPKDPKPGENPGGEDTKEPITGGEEKPSNPDPKAEKRPATGDEQGPGTAEDDPDANPTKAKNPLEREDPENPTTTQEREGEPEKLPTEKNPEKNPNSEKTPGTGNPDSDTTQKSPKPDSNPERTSNPEKNPADSKEPGKRNDQPNVGEDDLKGKGRPEGQQAEKPEGGEEGTSKQNPDGTPGGTEKGPGDNTKRPGDEETADKKNPGKPSEEPGPGSKTRPTERETETPRGKPNPQESPREQDVPNGKKPNDKTQPSSRGGKPGDPSSDDPNAPRSPEAGGPESRQNRNDGPITPESAREQEQQNLEFGREATDLTLKRLEEEIQRGDVNEEWLKEMGWDKADASKFLDRMKDRLEPRDDSTPEALAKKQQFEEWMKRVGRPKTNTARRTGSSLENEAARDLFSTPKTTVPPELRDIYKAYQRGISQGTR